MRSGFSDLKKRLPRLLRSYGLIVVGAAIYALAFSWCFDPNKISMGGVTGIAQIINRFVPAIPVGVTVVVLNIPLFIFGVKFQGFHVLFSSIFAMVISSIFIDILPLIVTFRPMEDMLVACIFGGALLGFSLGLMLFEGATTGGTELAASLLKRRFVHIQIGRICLIIDILVVITYAMTFGELTNALYAGIALFISSVTMDAVIYGRRTSKVACIICNDGKKVLSTLIKLDLGITEVKGKGGFSNEDKDILICAFKPSRIGAVKRAIVEEDPEAFVIVCDAKDVFGEGFSTFDINGL